MIANIASSRGPGLAARLLLSKAARRLAFVALISVLGVCTPLYAFHLSSFSLARTSGTSMEPYFHHGDAVIMRTVKPDSINVGDVVWFNRNGMPILHRVIQKYTTASGTTQLVTKGDNLPEADGPLSGAEVRGELALKLPLLGGGAQLLGVRDGFIFGELSALTVLLVGSASLLGLRAVRLSPAGSGGQRSAPPRSDTATVPIDVR